MSTLGFTDLGKKNHPTILLLHGFPFHRKIWNGYAESLAESARVVTVDLPGFGDSPILKTPFTLDDIARRILLWLDEQDVKTPFIVGHSLGGYIALAMAQQDPSRFAGLILFHSTAYADNEEKKESRNKVLDFINKNGVLKFTSNFIPPLFARPDHPAVEIVRETAIQASAEAVINYTIAMRDRPDRTRVLTDLHKPIMFISGDKDGGIPVESVKKQAQLNPSIETSVLNDCGHMGMFEKREETLSIIRRFTSAK
jgi:pimeloyl-ACP methyl ester carboxylesterase